MKCPYCMKPETKVVDKRDSDEGISRRRRECLTCEKRFTTYERVEAVPLTIIKKDGSMQQFDREKLMRGLRRACEKRPITQEQISQIVDYIEVDLKTRDSTEIKSSVIGTLLMKKLKKLDKVAFIRFASVYREFEDVTDFGEEIKKLMK